MPSGDRVTRIALSEFLEPYLHPPKGKKPKAIPDWIFELSPETKQELEDVHVFGLDLACLHTPPKRTSLDSTQPSSDRKGKARDLSPGLRSPPAGQAIVSPLGTMSPVLRRPESLDYQPDDQPEKDVNESEDDGMPIRPLPKPKRSRNEISDTVSLSRPSQNSSSLDPTNEETDEDELSDYERNQRKSALTRDPEQTSAGVAPEEEVKVTVTIQRDESLAEMESASHSMAESQRSAEDFSLSRYTKPAVSLPQMIVQSCILVDDSDPSGSKTTENQTPSQNMLQSRHAHASFENRHRLSIVERPVETEASASAHLDDELSQQRVTKRARTITRSSPSVLNPITSLDLGSAISVSKDGRCTSPTKKVEGSVEERPGSVVEKRAEGSKGRNADGLGEQGSVKTTEKDEFQSPRAPFRGTPVHREPREIQQVIIHRRSRSSSVRLIAGRPDPKFEAHLEDSSSLVDREPMLDNRKLNGFRPDLTLPDGLSEKWVLEMTKFAEDCRQARKA